MQLAAHAAFTITSAPPRYRGFSCLSLEEGGGLMASGNQRRSRVRSKGSVSVSGWLEAEERHPERMVGLSSPEPEGVVVL